MLNVSLTFDYELFFGSNAASDEEILFEPTSKLLDLLYKEKISSTFFVDVWSAIQARKLGNDRYANSFDRQLFEMSEKEQDIQLHIHPHWVHTKIIDGKWVFDNKHYKINDFEFGNIGDISADNIIIEGINYLTNTIRKHNKSYNCIAFRAGGFCIQPHAQLIELLFNNGIKVDSSVAPMLKSKDTIHYYDYMKKMDYVNWNISRDGAWWENHTNCSLFEIPVATENKKILAFILKRILHPNSIKIALPPRRGEYIDSYEIKKGKHRLLDYCKYLFGYSPLSMDAYNAEYLLGQLKRYYNKHECDSSNCTIAIIGHPKLVCDEYLANLENLIHSLKKEKNIRLCCIKEAYLENIYGSIH